MVEAIKRMNEREIVFCRRTSLQLLMLIFVFGGVFGFLYEEIFYRIDLGYFVKRGTTFGPWIPIYGFGAVLIVWGTEQLKKHPFMVFVVATLICGALEFLTGYVLYTAFGLRLWDYNVEIWNWGNVGGYICLRSVLFFGVSAMFLQYFAKPLFAQVAEHLEGKRFWMISVLPALFFVADIIFSVLGALPGLFV